jgi:hypothetical protein
MLFFQHKHHFIWRFQFLTCRVSFLIDSEWCQQSFETVVCVARRRCAVSGRQEWHDRPGDADALDRLLRAEQNRCGAVAHRCAVQRNGAVASCAGDCCAAGGCGATRLVRLLQAAATLCRLATSRARCDCQATEHAGGRYALAQLC